MNAPEKHTSLFSELCKLNCKDHVEKKGRFSYLSWPWAVQMLRERDPSATWEVRRFDGLPYCKTDTGYFVEVAVTASGVTLSQIHPVLDNNNRTIKTPDAFQINTSIQRCLVKAIALHGLGLYIYAGEDLPEPDKDGEAQTQRKAITASGSCADDLSDEDRMHVYESVKEAVAIYRESGDIQKVDQHLRFVAGLNNDMLAAVPYFLGNAQTEDGKKLSTAWTKYTKTPKAIELAGQA